MKAKKLISLLLAVIMIFSVMSVSVFAAPLKYTDTAKYTISSAFKYDASKFKVSISVDESKFMALEGGSTAYTATIDSIKIGDVDYLKDPEAFNALFVTPEGEEAKSKDLEIDFTIEFESDLIFGDLNYTIDVDGFAEPASVGSGSIDDIVGNITTDADIKLTGSFNEFPSIINSTLTVTSKPSKNEYYDSERFDMTGTSVQFDLTSGRHGELTYNANTARMFSSSPTNKENLNVNDKEVVLFFDGRVIAYIPISVSHKWSDGYVSITTNKFSLSTPGYHAIVCEGCGETHDAQPHDVDHEKWEYNNDQTFVANGTASNICTECGTVLTMDVLGSADYNNSFANYHFLLVIFDYINLLLRIINGAVNG